MKEARGQNKLFQNASIVMCYCSFENGQFLILKNQSERQAIELLFKVQISLGHPSSMLRHKAGQEGRGEILLGNSFLR